MSIQQLRFWDNESLEAGYQLLSNLEFEEAEIQFKEALNGAFGNAADVLQAMEACREWGALIEQSEEPSESNNSKDHVGTLLSAYKDFPFTSPMKKFSKALLSYITSLLCEMECMDLKNLETVFDLLLKRKMYNEAEKLIEVAVTPCPENRQLLYMKAQVLWLNGEKMKANQTYAWLLLYYPAHLNKERIENKKLISIIDTYGVAMAAAYGWLKQVIPLISLSHEIQIEDENHSKAIESYRLIISANTSRKDRDSKSTTQYRKRLKELSPELFDEYMKWVQCQE